MKRSRILVALVLFVFWSGHVRGQDIRLIETRPFRALQGVIKTSGEQPLSGAILLEVFDCSGGTDKTVPDTLVTRQYAEVDGSFSFPGLPEGVYELRVSVSGGAWNITRLYLKVQPDNPRAKTRPIELPLTLKD